jgi:hypothetical protein
VRADFFRVAQAHKQFLYAIIQQLGEVETGIMSLLHRCLRALRMCCRFETRQKQNSLSALETGAPEKSCGKYLERKLSPFVEQGISISPRM